MRLNFHLTTQLMLHSTLEELILGKDLERDDVFGAAFSCQIDLAEFSAAVEWRLLVLQR